jgi:hypothetical protein
MTMSEERAERMAELEERMMAAEAEGELADPDDLEEHRRLIRADVEELDAQGCTVPIPEAVRRELGMAPASESALEEQPAESVQAMTKAEPCAQEGDRPVPRVSCAPGTVNIQATAQDLVSLFGLETAEAVNLVGNQLMNACGKDAVGGKTLSEARVQGALALVGELRPNGAAETMLAVQAIAAQSLGMSLAAVGMQPGAKRNGIAQTALNAFRTSARLLGDLEKQKRGPVATQRVVVERVSVGDGGQAIVGAVTEGAPGGTRKRK